MNEATLNPKPGARPCKAGVGPLLQVPVFPPIIALSLLAGANSSPKSPSPDRV